MRWYPKNVGVWKRRFFIMPKICNNCGCRFCFELGWKVKSEVQYKIIKLGDKNRSNRFPVSYEWYCNSCRKQHRDKKIQDLVTRFFRGPDYYDKDIVGQLLGFAPTQVGQTKSKTTRKYKVK
jgi:hypothetical protein